MDNKIQKRNPIHEIDPTLTKDNKFVGAGKLMQSVGSKLVEKTIGKFGNRAMDQLNPAQPKTLNKIKGWAKAVMPGIAIEGKKKYTSYKEKSKKQYGQTDLLTKGD